MHELNVRGHGTQCRLGRSLGQRKIESDAVPDWHCRPMSCKSSEMEITDKAPGGPSEALSGLCFVKRFSRRFFGSELFIWQERSLLFGDFMFLATCTTPPHVTRKPYI